VLFDSDDSNDHAPHSFKRSQKVLHPLIVRFRFLCNCACMRAWKCVHACMEVRACVHGSACVRAWKCVHACMEVRACMKCVCACVHEMCVCMRA